MSEQKAEYTTDTEQPIQAGRELDIRIAALMGDVYDEATNTWYSTDGSSISCADGGPRLYSTDIAAMWHVITYMRANGWWYTLTDVQWNGMHQAEFRRVGDRGVHRFQYALAETEALAVCCAFLKVLQ